MEVLVSGLHVALGVASYLGFAILALVGVRRVGADLKDVGARTSPAVLGIGALANLGALLSVAVLLVVVDGKPVGALGLGLAPRDLATALVLAAATFGLGALFVRVRRQVRGWGLGPDVPAPNPPAGAGGGGSGTVALGVGVLALVALQEEVLYRGYVSLNLAPFGWPVVVVLGTAVFVLVHFLTNRAGPAQLASWTASGLVLAVAYLVSGSIWVAVIVHLAIDLSNVAVFDITGRSATADRRAPLSDRDRATFRVGYGVLAVLVLLAVYGLPVAVA
jgi:membrane protease YdiL (CAAX protease family)